MENKPIGRNLFGQKIQRTDAPGTGNSRGDSKASVGKMKWGNVKSGDVSGKKLEDGKVARTGRSGSPRANLASRAAATGENAKPRAAAQLAAPQIPVRMEFPDEQRAQSSSKTLPGIPVRNNATSEQRVQRLMDNVLGVFEYSQKLDAILALLNDPASHTLRVREFLGEHYVDSMPPEDKIKSDKNINAKWIAVTDAYARWKILD